MHKTTLYLEEDLREQIARVAREAGRSQAELVREVLRSFFVRRKKPRSVGAGKGGRNLSDRADELLKGFGEA